MLRGAGYYVGLNYFALDSIELNIERVRRRVEKGGHGIPETNIRQRYEGSLQKLSIALGCADEALLIDNSGIEPREIFRVGAGVIVVSAVDRRNPLDRLFEGRVVESCDLLVGEAYRSRTSIVGIRCRERRASCAISSLSEI
jgi:hypothetical protein